MRFTILNLEPHSIKELMECDAALHNAISKATDILTIKILMEALMNINQELRVRQDKLKQANVEP